MCAARLGLQQEQLNRCSLHCAGGVWCHPSGGGRVAAFSSASVFEDSQLDQQGNAQLADWCFSFLASVRAYPLLCSTRAP